MIDLVAQYLGDMAGCVGGRWQPRFGDPNLRRWALTVGYLLAGLMVGALSRAAAPDDRERRRVLVGAGLLLLCLGLNKQLDLQTLVRAIGHCESQRAGWYAVRNSIRQPVAAVLIAGGGVTALWVAFRHRRVAVVLPDLLLGLGLLLGYLGVRMAAWNKLGSIPVASPVVAALLPLAEPVGLGLVILGTGVRLLRGRRSDRLRRRVSSPPG